MRTTLTDKLIAGTAATIAVLGLQWFGFNPAARAAERDNLPPTPQMKESSGRGTTPAEKKTNRYPIRGKLKAVDTSAQTITLAGTEKDRVFKVTMQTEIIRGGKPATLAEALVGDSVGGLVERQPDGDVIALKVRFGPKTEAEQKPASKPKRLSPSSTAKTVDAR